MAVARRALMLVIALSVIVTAAPPAARVISLIPAVTEMLFAMGAGPDVIGVSRFDRFPSNRLSRTCHIAPTRPDIFEILLQRRRVHGRKERHAEDDEQEDQTRVHRRLFSGTCSTSLLSRDADTVLIDEPA